mmetsp:Transcript_13188/g.46138  ORF Transcript_13188/g.46138 Transcript_13188/m.46138 type:complete len:241 (+) Transcript_13188:897-1619(+)
MSRWCPHLRQSSSPCAWWRRQTSTCATRWRSCDSTCLCRRRRRRSLTRPPRPRRQAEPPPPSAPPPQPPGACAPAPRRPRACAPGVPRLAPPQRTPSPCGCVWPPRDGGDCGVQPFRCPRHVSDGHGTRAGRSRPPRRAPEHRARCLRGPAVTTGATVRRCGGCDGHAQLPGFASQLRLKMEERGRIASSPSARRPRHEERRPLHPRRWQPWTTSFECGEHGYAPHGRTTRTRLPRCGMS